MSSAASSGQQRLDFADLTTAMAAFVTQGFAEFPEPIQAVVMTEARLLATEKLNEFIESFAEKASALAVEHQADEVSLLSDARSEPPQDGA